MMWPMRYVLVDVFAARPLEGNPLAVFAEPGAVPEDRMQAIARELNLSESTFVAGVGDGGYDVRIFTPGLELPFAGHPTLGTSWVLRDGGVLKGDRVVQRSGAGETPVTFEGDLVWLERPGTVTATPHDTEAIARALGADPTSIGADAAALGGSGKLEPRLADAGVSQLMVPFARPEDLAALAALPTSADLADDGVYCYAPMGPGRVKARFFGAGVGVTEDPATGSAAAALGLALAEALGEVEIEISQGAEIGRPSTLYVRVEPGRVRVGGRVIPVGTGDLHL